MTKKSNRNEGRTTNVKFMFWNPEEGGTPYERNEKIPYTRSDEIARKTLSDMFHNCMIQVVDLEQEEVKRVSYNLGKVNEYKTAAYETAEEAEAHATETQTIIPFTMYGYDGHVWMKDGDEFFTEYIADESPVKFGISETRSFIKLTAENIYDNAVCIGTYETKRYELKRFAIVENENLELCVKES